MNDQKHGIPTIYKGIQMRSRAEARWAAFFDEMGWEWLYEPIDLDGYIPDFYLLGRGGAKPCIVEVKGGILDPNGLKAISASIHPSVDLLLPASPSVRVDGDVAHIGSARGTPGIEGSGWSYAVVGCCHTHHCRGRRPSEHHVGLDDTPCVLGETTKCMLCGHVSLKDPDYYGRITLPHPSMLKKPWAIACNATQWRSPVRA